jgi:outer membrane protein assembly factor BamB
MRKLSAKASTAFVVIMITGALLIFAGCPENESSYQLPESYKPLAIKVKAPLPECIWPRAGGGYENRSVSVLEGPRSFKQAWEIDLGDGAVLSPVVDADGRIYTGELGGELHCISHDGVELFKFGAQTENSTTFDGLRSQPALGDGQIWMATDGGLVCIDFSGKELFRIAAKDLPEGGIANVAIAPDGRLIVCTRLGSVIVFSDMVEPVATIKTKGSVASPASFNEDGDAFVGCSDKSMYSISKDGRLFGQLIASDAMLAAPCVGENRLYATAMDGYVYCSDYRGRLRWNRDLIFDAETQDRMLKKVDENAILGLYWSPLLRIDDSVPPPAPAQSIPAEDVAGRDADTGFELLVPVVDRPERFADATIAFSWFDEEGERKLRKVLAKSFIAERVFGAQPVMDANGKVYFAWDNNIAISKGKDIIANFTIAGDGKVSGAQPVITRDKRFLLPMNDGRLICLEEADEATTGDGSVDGQTATSSNGEAASDGQPDTSATSNGGQEVVLDEAEKHSVMKFAHDQLRAILKAEGAYYGKNDVIGDFRTLLKEGLLDKRYDTDEFSQLGVRINMEVDNETPAYKVTANLPGGLGVMILDQRGEVAYYPDGIDGEAISMGNATVPFS